MTIYPVRIQFKTACQILDVSRETLNQLIKLDPTFPQKIKMETAKQSSVYFDYAELAEWHNSQKQGLAAMEA